FPGSPRPGTRMLASYPPLVTSPLRMAIIKQRSSAIGRARGRVERMCAMSNDNRPVCPTNQQAGAELDTQTVKALLAGPPPAVAAVGCRVVSPEAAYRFCPAADCPTVYYRADGQQVFDEGALRERVYQKHADDPDSLICYCFGFTVGDIRAELAHTGRSAIRR